MLFLYDFWFVTPVPFSLDIEDFDNWHGKPIPKDRVDDLLNDLQALIQVPNRTLSPELPNEDAAPVDDTPIHLLAPPAYNKGDKVPLCFLISLIISCMSFTSVYILSWNSLYFCLTMGNTSAENMLSISTLNQSLGNCPKRSVPPSVNDQRVG